MAKPPISSNPTKLLLIFFFIIDILKIGIKKPVYQLAYTN
jgi:hypothetical protein